MLFFTNHMWMWSYTPRYTTRKLTHTQYMLYWKTKLLNVPAVIPPGKWWISANGNVICGWGGGGGGAFQPQISNICNALWLYRQLNTIMEYIVPVYDMSDMSLVNIWHTLYGSGSRACWLWNTIRLRIFNIVYEKK